MCIRDRPGPAQELHRDHRSPGTGGGGSSRSPRGEMKRRLLVFVWLTLLAPGVFAHEVRPAYLELRQSGPETYDALWKVPGRGEDQRLGLYVELPSVCTNLTRPRGSMANNAFTERWTVKCAGGLIGGRIHIAGLNATNTDVLVRLERLDGTAQVTRLTPSAPSLVVEAAAGVAAVSYTHVVLGVEHILTGTVSYTHL